MRYTPYMIERIVVSLSYLTMGIIGFIWIVLGAFTKAQISGFARYHIFQAIFISITLFLISYLLGIIAVMNYSIIQIAMYLFIAYLMITSALGIFTYVPFISDIIAENTGRR